MNSQTYFFWPQSHLFDLFSAGCDKDWNPEIRFRFLGICRNSGHWSACCPWNHCRLLQMPTHVWHQGSETGKHIFTFSVKNGCTISCTVCCHYGPYFLTFWLTCSRWLDLSWYIILHTAHELKIIEKIFAFFLCRHCIMVSHAHCCSGLNLIIWNPFTVTLVWVTLHGTCGRVLSYICNLFTICCGCLHSQLSL